MAKSLLTYIDSALQVSAQGTHGSTTASFQIISVVSDFTEARRTPKLPCYIHRGHTRNQRFFGRMDVLAVLADVLLPSVPLNEEEGASALRTYCLCGLGGIGKSEIAAEFMFANKSRYDAIFWLQADNTTKLREGFSQIATELGLEDAAGAKDQIASISLVKNWMANPLIDPNVPDHEKEAKWLLIFDNVDDPDDLNDYWPQFGRGSVLITSRDPFAKSNVYSSVQGMDLSPFSDHEAAIFLISLTQEESDANGVIPNSALAVARKLGGLPLGLMQMAGIINRRDYTFEEFLKKYDEKLIEMLSSNVGRRPEGYPHTIASVWALERLNKTSASLLDVLALLDPDCIQEDMLRKGDYGPNLPSYSISDDSYQDARADLTKRSLITRNKKTQELRLHRLTQDAARAKMSSEYFLSIFVSVIHMLSSIWPYAPLGQRHDISRWPLCESLIPHVIRLYEYYTSFRLPDNVIETVMPLAEILTDSAW